MEFLPKNFHELWWILQFLDIYVKGHNVKKKSGKSGNVS